LIRHAGPSLPLAVGPLMVTVIQPPLGALLVATVGLTTLLSPCLLAAALTAVLLPAVTGTADPENHAAPIGPAKSLTKSQSRSARHSFPERRLNNSHRSWQTTFPSEVVLL